MTLKVGDKVRVRPTGRFGTVVADRDHGFYDVRDPGRTGPSSVTPGALVYQEGNLEKIEPEPKFKVGDRVRLVHGYDHLLPGAEGVVREADPAVAPGKRFIYEVDFDTNPGWPYSCYEERLEKIEEEPPRPLGLRAGDKVVNLKTGREGLVLKGPVSGELKVYDQKPPIRDAVPAQALEEYEFHYPGTYDVWRRATPKRDFLKLAQPW